MAWVDELLTRLKAKHKEWDKAKDEVRLSKEREQKLREEFMALQILWNAEQPKNRKAESETAAAAAVSIRDTNKAELVRLVVQDHGTDGMTPAQIRAVLEMRKINMPTNYLYSILMRAKKTGRIVEKDGKYYSPEETARVAS